MEIPTGVAEEPRARETAITVQFIQADSSDVIESSQWALSDSVAAMKEALSQSWNQPAEDISISYQGEALSDATRVEELGPEPGQPLALVVQTINTQLDGIAPGNSKPYVMPSTFTVQVEDGREVLVKVERQSINKPFLGGYKHKLSGVQYLNASAQTLPKKRSDNGITKYQRDTQTVLTKNKRQQVNVDAATQMNKTGCFVNNDEDRVIPITGTYETADEYHARILGHVIVLQTYWRRWLASRYVTGLRRDKQLRDEWERSEVLRRQREREERARREFERRMNPRTKEDFDLLYHALEMWRQDELRTINETTSGAERKAALCGLLEQEAELIASIGQHKIEANKDHREKVVQKFLDATAAPKRWIAFDGNVTEMDTQFSLRAQQLRDIYQTITLGSLTRDERLDVLLTLKCTVKEHDCKLTRDIVELVDREADMLVRGLDSGESLKGLRKRISGLFYQYAKTPLFNPEAAKHIKVPQDPSALRSNVYYCRSCCKYLPSTDFELSTNSRVVSHCRQCKDLDNKARARDDFTIYRAMLKSIRKTEEHFPDKSHIVFLIQEPDLRYLTENIWGGQSALSAEKDLFELLLVRWGSGEQWSPWNCVLLTKDEAKGHCKLKNVDEAYGSQFIRKVHHRHVLAKNYFSRIPDMADQMKIKVKELPLPRPKEREIIIRTEPDTKTVVEAS